MFIFSLRSLIIFYRELATMINSNLNIIESLDILSNHIGDHKMKIVATAMKRCLLSGSTLSEALAKFPKLFPEWQVNIVKYTETGGKLKEGLESIVSHLEKEYAIQKKLILGLAYPVLLLHLAIFLLPIAAVLTRGLIGYGFEVLKVLVPLYFFFFMIYVFKRLLFSKFKKGYDGFILYLPVFGNLVKRLSLIRFIRTFKCLYDSGVDIIQSWSLAVSLCNNSIIRESLLKGLPVIKQGGELISAFTTSQVFSKKMLGMIAIGEKSGSINKMLEKMALYCEHDNDAIINLLLIIMPVITFMIVAAYIGYRIISFYFNYFSQVLSF